MKAYWGRRGIDSLIFNFGSRRGWVGCGRFNPGKNAGTHWIGERVNLRSILEVVSKRKCLAPTRIWVPFCPAPKLVSVPTTNPRLTPSLYRGLPVSKSSLHYQPVSDVGDLRCTPCDHKNIDILRDAHSSHLHPQSRNFPASANRRQRCSVSRVEVDAYIGQHCTSAVPSVSSAVLTNYWPTCRIWQF